MAHSRFVLVVAFFCHIVSLAACAQAPARVETRRAGPQSAAAASKAPVAQSADPAVATAPPAIAQPAPEGAADASGEYRLGPGDIVKISVYGNTDLATETEVSQGGKISFPLVGEVQIGGLTRGEAEKAISDSLGRGGFVPNAYVNLLVSQYRSQQISIVGEVNKPGNYPINRASSVTELLAMAGGITPKGSNVITIIRKDGQGGTVRHEVNVRSLFAGKDGLNMRIGQDDVIYVPPMPVFYIYGEVRQPGSYPLSPEMTVRQALSVGGGLTVRGTVRGIRIERKGEAGKTFSRNPHLDDRLRPDDVVQVPESWF
jgi:polysaccharide export outer membrane protein